MNLKDRIFLFVRNIIEEKERPSFFKSVFKFFLILLSYIYCFLVFLKNFAYDIGLLRPYKSGCRVISIGNVVAGGTGKTPFTIYLAERFFNKGHKVAVVSRGYRAKNLKKGMNVVSCLKENTGFSYEDMGDEPYLISRRLPEIYVIAGKDKIKSVQLAEKLRCDIILLDDGFQSRYIYRDLDIVLLNCDSPFSNGYFLPAGFLRDSKKSLKRAGLAVFTDCEKSFSLPSVEMFCPAVCSSSNFSFLRDLSGKEMIRSLKKIAIFCAIANPERFQTLLKKQGYEIVESRFFLDHVYFSENYLKSFSKRAEDLGAEALICTEKDFVKLQKNILLSLPVYYVQMDLEITEGKEKLEQLFQALGEKL